MASSTALRSCGESAPPYYIKTRMPAHPHAVYARVPQKAFTPRFKLFKIQNLNSESKIRIPKCQFQNP